MNSPPAVELTGLSKSFGDIQALQDVSMSIQHGEIFAFLGPNGAGKSTTMKILSTLLKPSGGRAKVAGHDCATDVRGVRRSIGIVFQEKTLDDQLTAEENLRIHAVLYGIPRAEVDRRIDEVLDLVDLTERRAEVVATLSGGLARRLEIARALLHDTKILFLDEPTVGLDPHARARIWRDILLLRAERNLTVVMTTHYMDEAEQADRIAIIDRGQIVAIGTPKELKLAVRKEAVILATSDDQAARKTLAAAGFEVETEGTGVIVRVQDGEAAVAPIMDALDNHVHTISVHRPSLDDVFLHFTGHSIREDADDALTRARVLTAGGSEA